LLEVLEKYLGAGNATDDSLLDVHHQECALARLVLHSSEG
jgi:hypothetical protein